MATFDFVQSNFTRGELSPRLRGRIDFEGFFNGVETLNNFVVLPLGGVQKRSGTRFVAEVDNSSDFSRLIPFQFNVEQAFALEFGDQKVRVLADGGVLTANAHGAAVSNGDFSGGSTGWTDASNGTGDVVFENVNGVDVASLESAGSGNEAVLRQAITIPSGDENTILSLRFDTLLKAATKSLTARIKAGTSAGANDILDRIFNSGSHVVDVDPGGASTVYIEFEAAYEHTTTGAISIANVAFLSAEPLEVGTPYTSGQVNFINWTQSADVLFLVHPSIAPREFRRFGPAEFSLVQYDFQDGPYLETNLTGTELTPVAISGRVSVTASSTDGINGNRGFQDGDVGRLIRLKTTETASVKAAGDGSKVKFTFPFFVPETDSIRVTLTNTGSGTIQNIAEGSTVDAFEGSDYSVTLNNPQAGGEVDFTVSKAPATDIEVSIIRDISFWGWTEILEVTNATEVQVLVRGDSGLGAAAATLDWRLGGWGDNQGWPQTATFHRERLTFGGSDSKAQTLWFSKVSDFNSFSPSTTDGTVNDDNSINITLATSQVNFIRWLSSINSGLAVGTSGAEFLIRAATTTEALSPKSVEAIRQTTRGSEAFVPPTRVGLSTIFIQRGAEKMRELAFDFNVDGLVARDFSLTSEHLLRPGLFRVEYQQNPDSVLWSVRGDKRLLGFTLESDQQVFAWHQHTIGGTAPGGGDAEVESMTVTTEGDLDRVWLIVRRQINGASRRYVEIMERPWQFTEQTISEAFYVDSGLTGTFATPQSTIQGLGHLEGETVKVMVDGSPHPDRTVSEGEITLDRAGSVVHVGFGYEASMQTFPMDEGLRGEISRGKVKRISQVHLLFHETVGAKFGREKLDRIPFRDSSMLMDQPVPPFTGEKSFRMPMRHDTLAWVRVVSDQPLPATILNLTAEMEFFDT